MKNAAADLKSKQEEAKKYKLADEKKLKELTETRRQLQEASQKLVLAENEIL